MGYVKASKGGLDEAEATAQLLTAKIEEAIGNAGAFASAASSEVSNWVESYWELHYEEPSQDPYKETTTDSNGVQHTNWKSGGEAQWEAACDAAKQAAKDYVAGQASAFSGDGAQVSSTASEGTEPAAEVQEKIQIIIENT